VKNSGGGRSLSGWRSGRFYSGSGRVGAGVGGGEELGTAESGLGFEDGGVAEGEILGMKWDRWKGKE
jgi:hypothetical protein